MALAASARPIVGLSVCGSYTMSATSCGSTTVASATTATNRGGSRVRIVKRQRVDGRATIKLVKHIGTARNEEELEILKMISETDGSRLEETRQVRFDFSEGVPRGIFTIGFHHFGSKMVLGTIVDSLGISIGRLTPLLRLLTIARVIHPGSKRYTANWIKDSLGSGYSLDQIYRH